MNTYLIDVNGKRSGPYIASELYRLRLNGQLPDDAKVIYPHETWDDATMIKDSNRLLAEMETYRPMVIAAPSMSILGIVFIVLAVVNFAAAVFVLLSQGTILAVNWFLVGMIMLFIAKLDYFLNLSVHRLASIERLLARLD